jgi:hypothetical protein
VAVTTGTATTGIIIGITTTIIIIGTGQAIPGITVIGKAPGNAENPGRAALNVLPEESRLFGPLEGLTGILMCRLSGAFLRRRSRQKNLTTQRWKRAKCNTVKRRSDPLNQGPLRKRSC